jgi:hypothetical protein
MEYDMNAEGTGQGTVGNADGAEPSDIVGRETLARRIGVDVRTVDRMVARQELPPPCIGQGGRPRWLWSYVVEFLRKRHERQAQLDQRMAAKTRAN